MSNIHEHTTSRPQAHDLPIIDGEPVRAHKFAGKPWPESVEQMCRNLLSQAKSDGLVTIRDGYKHGMSGGDLAGMANLLLEYLRNGRNSRG